MRITRVASVWECAPLPAPIQAQGEWGTFTADPSHWVGLYYTYGIVKIFGVGLNRLKSLYTNKGGNFITNKGCGLISN